MGRHEHQPVVIRIAQSELDVTEPGFLQALDRMANLGDLLEFTSQSTEIRVAKLVDELVFVFEVEINCGGRILDSFGNLSHRDRFVALARKQSAGSVENLLPQLLLFSFAPLNHAHSRPRVIGDLSLNDV